ncbi:MAG: tetratricopeptide repeat protein [Gemmatimonadaceae bacterium]
MTTIFRPSRALLNVLFLASLTACGPRGDAAPTVDSAQSDPQLMEKGTQLLYQSGDPVAAEEVFRQVLSRTPTHYGAHYQLAVAMDRGGKPSEARAEWNEILKMADAIKDSATLQSARSRLAMPDTASQVGLMARGVHLMYKQNKAAEAVDQFRAVLARNPTHYGATYQLAVALDRVGRAAEAKPVWERVLPMAIRFKDQRTVDTVRARLR